VAPVAGPVRPPRRPEAPTDRDLARPGGLETHAPQAGLTPGIPFQTTCALEYPDRETLGRALLAPAGLATLAGPEREEAVRDAIVVGLAPYRTADGSYRLSNEYHYLIARA